jgi:hypothetical protein
VVLVEGAHPILRFEEVELTTHTNALVTNTRTTIANMASHVIDDGDSFLLVLFVSEQLLVLWRLEFPESDGR